MSPIFLKMGKSTILRFVEKPKKVVVGNQNYYGLEFIENDVAIQPLGAVGTNLFVYTEHHTYGFLLTPGERYDDLVFVRWRYPQVRASEPPKSKSNKVVAVNAVFRLGDNLKVVVNQVQGPSAFGLHIIDFTVENVGKSEVNIAALNLRASRKGKAFDHQSIVVERDHIKPGERSKVRMLLKLDGVDDFTIDAAMGTGTGKVVIGHKYL